MHFGLLRSRRRRVLRPSPEAIESRVLLSGYSPTDVEQYYLELLDDARFNPAAYGQSLGIDLSSVAPAQPLAMNEQLVESARLHSQDMIDQNYFSHTSPQGTDPGDRIAAAGFAYTGWAESIETNTNPAPSSQGFPANYGAWDAGYSLGNLIVDQGVPDLGHRIMLLDIGGLDHAMQQVGIGIASQDSTSGGFDLSPDRHHDRPGLDLRQQSVPDRRRLQRHDRQRRIRAGRGTLRGDDRGLRRGIDDDPGRGRLQHRARAGHLHGHRQRRRTPRADRADRRRRQ